MARHGIIFLLAIILTLVNPLALRAQTDDIEARRARLQAELEAEERAIAEQTKLLEAKQRDTATVQGEVDLLKAEIRRAETNIKAKKVQISRLDDDIANRQTKILTLDAKIKREQGSLAELLRKTRDMDSASFVEILLDNNHLSEFFNDVDDLAFVQKSIHQAFAEMRGTQEAARQEKKLLEERKNKEIDAQKVIENEQRLIAAKEKDKQALLSINKTQEAAYKQILAERQRRAAQIRAALFALRDTAAIPFGKALEYATVAQKQTGIRPALTLAILTQESNLGAHQGSCLVADLATGDGVGKNTGTPFQQIMKAPRDTVPFEVIANRLGLDWKMTPVSCPPQATYYVGRGFGGGMGPSQFIPSTWELFKARVGAAVGVAADAANPWNPGHSFMATAIYMSDLGAGAGGYTAERNAACRYYSGRPCDSRAPANSFYGDQVMQKAADIQLNMIDPLQNL